MIERTTALQLVGRLVDAARRREGEGDLHDRGHQLWLLEQREAHVLDGLARRLRRGGDVVTAVAVARLTSRYLMPTP
jgi:acyl-CoA oxidase